MGTRALLWSCAVVLLAGVAVGAQRFWEAREFDESIARAEKFYMNCVSQRQQLGQVYYLCREWSYAHIAGTATGATRTRLLELSAEAAIRSAERCRADLEERVEQLRMLENEIRGPDGLYHPRGSGDRDRMLQLRNSIESTKIDCRSLEYDIDLLP